MKIKAHFAMVLNLDKCIGCHTCSIPCKNVWTNHRGAEYIWYNNVESKPGIGYPKKWEDQSLWKGGWTLKERDLSLYAGNRLNKMAKLFYNPDLPKIDDYYEPWTYSYEELIESPVRKHQPAIRPRSLLTGENLEIKWGPNWEDDLAGAHVTGVEDPNFEGVDAYACMQFEKVFMLHLPRICEHCLNPSCVASCPAGAIYKREEDGIVLVDQEACRSWRFCVSGCPYKKVYYNWKSGRSEKCLFCYPRVEAGMPTLCAETCVGRIRYIGLILYDADKIRSAASVEDPRDLRRAQMEMFLDPHDPATAAEALGSGIPENYLAAARRSPIYKLAVQWGLALPLHPEFRTLPMVWYVPPLSPLLGVEGDDVPDLDRMRIPVRFLANLLASGDETPVRVALKRLSALRSYMRTLSVEGRIDPNPLEEAGIDQAAAAEMYRLLAIARYHDRYVIPTVKKETRADLFTGQGQAGYPPETLE